MQKKGAILHLSGLHHFVQMVSTKRYALRRNGIHIKKYLQLSAQARTEKVTSLNALFNPSLARSMPVEDISK